MRSTSRFQASLRTPVRVSGCWMPILQTSRARARPGRSLAGRVLSSSAAGRRIEVFTLPDVTWIAFVVDDDVSVRESLELLVSTAGWQPAGADRLLATPRAFGTCRDGPTARTRETLHRQRTQAAREPL